MPPKPQLPLEARRIRTILFTAPIMAATAYILYKRLVLEEPQRTLPTAHEIEVAQGKTQ